jgi:hypothetical protein
MSLLNTVQRDAKRVYEAHKHRLPTVPKIPLVEATPVPATPLFAPQELTAGSPETVTSAPIFLQTGSNDIHSFAVDLANLHAGIVFSVILSNSPSDLLGKKKSTILVRNGVTATAARKRANGDILWFYHGKPMNGGDMRLHVTVGRDQMTFAYREEVGGRLYVHGDCPVSRLSVEHIGDVRGMPFYVHVYTKDKTAGNKNCKGPVMIRVLDIEGTGYVHEAVGEDERNDFGFEIIEHEDAVAASDVPGCGLSTELAGLMLE